MEKQIRTEISTLAQTTLGTKYNRPLPTPQLLLKSFFTCSKNRKNQKKSACTGPNPCNLRVKVVICQKNNFFLQRFIRVILCWKTGSIFNKPTNFHRKRFPMFEKSIFFFLMVLGGLN